jgi:DnaJ-domain-containing protein 1
MKYRNLLRCAVTITVKVGNATAKHQTTIQAILFIADMYERREDRMV